MTKTLLALFCLFCGGAFSANASLDYRPLAQSPRANLMGKAFTAIADDEFTLFYNPAALGRNRGAQVSPINLSFALTNALDDSDRFKDFPSEAVDIAERVMDYPLHLNLQTAPGVKMGGFALSFFANSTTNIVLQNNVIPMMDIDYRFDRGFVLGYAFNITPQGVRMVGMGPSHGHRLSLGASAKFLRRDAMVDQYNFFGTGLLNAIVDASDISEIRKNLGYSKGKALGTDIGLEYGYRTQHSEFTLGLAMMDFLDTKFKVTEGEGVVPTRPMTFNLGGAFHQSMGPFYYALSTDLHSINSDADYRRKLHMGARVGMPFLDFFGGWSEGYLSYGLGVNFWPLRLVAGFYGEEIGTSYNDRKGSRAIIYLSLLDTRFSF